MINARRTRYDDAGQLLLEGGMRFSQGQRRLQAERARYLEEEDRIELEGEIRYHDPYLWLESERGVLRPSKRSARFEQLRYRLADRPGGGHAARLERTGDLTRLHDLDYSSCPEQPPPWRLEVRDLELDHAAGSGTARGALLRLLEVPVFYLPYLSFPIGNQRKSGFLYPVLGQSGRGGLDLRLPFYWNIAPQRDATFHLRTLSRRGGLLGAEYRQLHSGGRTLLYGELLPSDRAWDKRLRGLLRLELEQHLPGGWKAELYWRSVSDHRYLEDLGDTLGQTSERRLEQRLELRRRSGGLDLAVRLLNFQELAPEPGNRASRLLPEVEWTYSAGAGAATTFTLHGSLSNFRHGTQAAGLRLDLAPRVGQLLRRGAGRLESSLTLRYTGYRLERSIAGLERVTHRLLPELRLDGGLSLAAGGGRRFLHLFEPRLLYRFVPYRNQSRLPLFDTARVDFSRAFLNSNADRFSGADRVGDDNRLGLLFGGRVLERDSGRQWAEWLLGHYFHLRRQRVGLPGKSSQTGRATPLVAALRLDPAPAWRWQGEAHWSPDRAKLVRGTTSLQYRPQPGRVINLGYRYRQEALELNQADFSFHWELGPRWALAGRWQRSLQQASDLDLFLGLEYRHCCWQLRLLGRRFTSGGTRRHDHGLFLELALPGLGALGYDIVELFQAGIRGYRD